MTDQNNCNRALLELLTKAAGTHDKRDQRSQDTDVRKVTSAIILRCNESVLDLGTCLSIATDVRSSPSQDQAPQIADPEAQQASSACSKTASDEADFYRALHLAYGHGG